MQFHVITLFYNQKTVSSGDIETKPNSDQNFWMCQPLEFSIATHNFTKVSLLKVCIYNCDIISLSETYLGSSIASDDDRLETIYLERTTHPIGNNEVYVSIIKVHYLWNHLVFVV